MWLAGVEPHISARPSHISRLDTHPGMRHGKGRATARLQRQLGHSAARLRRGLQAARLRRYRPAVQDHSTPPCKRAAPL